MISRHARTRLYFAGALAIVSLRLATPASAQSQLEQTLRQFDNATVRGYVQPLADLLSADINTGFFHSASIPVSKLSIGLEVVGMGAQVKEEHKTYTANTPAGFTPSTFETATIFGGTGTTVNDASSGTSYRGSDGFIDATYLPFAAPQIRVGGIFGTEVVFRYFSTGSLVDDEDVPTAKLMGFGGRHNISQYFNALPVDIAIGAFYDSIKIEGDSLTIDIKSLSYGAQIGKTFSILSVYGGVSSENGTMSINLVSTDPANPVNINRDVDTERHIRATAGLGIKLGPLGLFGDANFGKVTNFTGGLRLGF